MFERAGFEMEKTELDLQRFVFDTPLYEIINATSESGKLFSDLFNHSSAKIDGHCTGCGRNSVFHSQRMSSSSQNISDLGGIRSATLFCQRDHNHKIVIFTEMEYEYKAGAVLDLAVRKIGQIPTHADIASGTLKELAATLDQEDRREFVRANGLAAHGVNIGAFVYLRRVFERLVWRASKRSVKQVEAVEFARMRMNEKIDSLRDVLPQFLVSNSKIYAVLSKGIHELDEDTCGKNYELMKQSVLLMLEQEKEILDRQKRESELEKLVGKMSV